MTSRVGHVHVRLTLAESERSLVDETRRELEQVTIRRALEELEQLVHARHGSSVIVRVRHLSLRWQIDRDQLADAAPIMARDLAESILGELDSLSRPDKLRPPPEANVVMFEDGDHAVAAFLADHAAGSDGWFHAPRVSPVAEWSAICRGGNDRVAAVVRWLGRMDALRPAVDQRERTAKDAPDVLPMVRAAFHHQNAGTIREVTSSPDENVPTHGASGDRPRAAAASSSGIDPAVPAVDSWAHPDTATIHSEVAGVWYLARLVLRLDLAEHLWCAGVHEGAFLAHVIATLLGGSSPDPAWRWFGGAFDAVPVLDSLPTWAADEVDAKLLASLERELGTQVVLDDLAAALPTHYAVDPRTGATVSRCAAALCHLFCACLSHTPDIQRVRTAVAIPGLMERDDDQLTIQIPMEHVDVDLRRAGLDFDPGWVPWLERRVSIVFVQERDV